MVFGSLGTGGSDYDGDSLDIVTFETTEEYLSVPQPGLRPGEPVVGVILDLFDADGDLLESGTDDDFDGYIDLSYGTDAGDVSPFYLHISSSAGFGDYNLYGEHLPGF